MTTTTTDPSSSNYRAPGPPRGGEGGNVVHAVIEGQMDTSSGIELGIIGDASWALNAIERNPGSRAAVALEGLTLDSSVIIVAPIEFTSGLGDTWEEANGFILEIEQGRDFVAEIPEVPMGPPTLGIRGTPGVAAVNASVTVDVTATSTVLVERLPAGTDGNDWEIQLGISSAVLSGGIQVLTITGARNTLAVTIQDSDIPTIAEFTAAITNTFGGGFRATATTGNPNAQISTALASLLPNGTTGNNTRSEDFTGGANAVAAIPAQAAMAGSNASVRINLTAGALTFTRDAVGAAGNDWRVRLIPTQDGVVVNVDEDSQVISILIGNQTIPTGNQVAQALAPLDDFTTEFVVPSNGVDPFPDFATVFPDGDNIGLTIREEHLSGGVDALPELQDLPAGVETPAVAASLTIVLPDGGILVTRDTVGADGNLWSLTIEPAALSLFGASSDGVITQLAQSGGGGGTLRVMVATNNIPLVLDVVFDINASVGFNAVLVGGADEDMLLTGGPQVPITPETLLPNGGPFGILGRIQSLSGGVDFIPAPFDAPGTPAIPAIPAVPELGLAWLLAGDPYNWRLRVQPSATLDEIADYVRVSGTTQNIQATGEFLDFGQDNVVLIGDGDSILDGAIYFAGNVGDLTQLMLSGALNEVLAYAEKDEDTKIVTIAYNDTDTSAEILALLTEDVVLGASLIGLTGADINLEDAGFVRFFRGIGGGGGGGGAGGISTLFKTNVETTKITFEEALVDSIDFTETNMALDTGIAVPANTKTFHINYGSSYAADDSGIDLIWFAIPIEEWNRLDGVDAGDAPTQENVRFTRTWRDADLTSGGGTAARQVWLSRGNNGNIFVMSDSVSYDIIPFRVRFEIHEAVSVLSDVTTGRATAVPMAPVAPVVPVTSGGLSEIRILAPASDPTRENWVEGAAQWTGESLVPVVRELAGVHEAIIHFATIDPATGMEIIETTDVYATMRQSANLNTTVAWLWAAGQLVRVGNLAYRVEGLVTTYYRCIRRHTTIVGDVANGPPNVAGQTGWEVYAPVSAVAADSFRGVFRDTQDVPAPLASGQWVVTTAAGYAYPERYTVAPDRWLRYIIPSVVLFGQIFTDNEEAYGHIQSFNSSEPQYLLIGGFLKILTWYTAPAVGHEAFHARAVQRSNPRGYFWVRGQVVRDPQGDVFPSTVPATGEGVAILQFDSQAPNQSYDNGDVVYANGTRATGAVQRRRLLTPPRGRHDITLFLESDYSTIGDMLSFSLFKDSGGFVDTRYLGQFRVESLVAIMGVTVTVRLMVPDVETDGTEGYFFRIDGLAASSDMSVRGYAMIEYKGD